MGASGQVPGGPAGCCPVYAGPPHTERSPCPPLRLPSPPLQVSGLNTGAGQRWGPGGAAVRAPAAPAGGPACRRSPPCLAASPSASRRAASPVDSILDKESYTLEELLDEDELIQECKSLNARLTAYLKQKETVERLVRSGGGWDGWLS